MKKRIIFATGNENKMKEIRMILEDLGISIYSMKEVGIHIDIEENGTTFEENAMIKAKAISELLPDDIVLADDSGLEIDYMDKAPGIYSARFAGVDTPYDVKNTMILDKMRDVPDEERTARFVCVIAAVFPGGSSETVRGIFEGRIGHESIGQNGFGYDPIFYVPECKCTSAQMEPDKKNKRSHRGNALRAMRKVMENKLK